MNANTIIMITPSTLADMGVALISAGCMAYGHLNCAYDHTAGMYKMATS